jgi:small subunit ribosomal protein S17
MAEKKQLTTAKRRFQGVVVKNAAMKTAVVTVETTKKHPKYLKSYLSTKKFKIHDELNECKAGNQVVFEECRPLSRDKRWRLIKIVK